jgi:HlyD family secretion protein
MKRTLVPVLVLGALLASGCAGTQSQPAPTAQAPIIPAVVSASGKVLPVRWANLSFSSGGYVSKVEVQVGDKVEAGQVLTRLDDVDARLAKAQADAALQMAQAQLAQLKAGARPEEIARQTQAIQAAQAALAGASARLDQLQQGARSAELAEAESALRQAQAEWRIVFDSYDAVTTGRDMVKAYNVRGGGLGELEESLRYRLQAATQAVTAAQARLDQLKAGPTSAELRAAQAEVEAAQARLVSAQAQLDQMQAGPTAEQIAVSEANVAQMKAAAELAQAALDKTQLKAPFGGTVGGVYARVGEMLTPGQPVVALGDLSALRVETTDLSEVDVARVAVGLPASVTFDGLPGKSFPGRVARIAPMSSSGQGGVNYAVLVELDQLDPALKWGMTAFTDIQIK